MLARTKVIDSRFQTHPQSTIPLFICHSSLVLCKNGCNYPSIHLSLSLLLREKGRKSSQLMSGGSKMEDEQERGNEE